MAPESLQDHLYTSKSDVWSFGAIIIVIVTTRIPIISFSVSLKIHIPHYSRHQHINHIHETCHQCTLGNSVSL